MKFVQFSTKVKFEHVNKIRKCEDLGKYWKRQLKIKIAVQNDKLTLIQQCADSDMSRKFYYLSINSKLVT